MNNVELMNTLIAFTMITSLTLLKLMKCVQASICHPSLHFPEQKLFRVIAYKRGYTLRPWQSRPSLCN